MLVRLTEGPDAGKQVTVDIPAGPGAPTVAAGEAVGLTYLPDSFNGKPYQIVDHRVPLPAKRSQRSRVAVCSSG